MLVVIVVIKILNKEGEKTIMGTLMVESELLRKRAEDYSREELNNLKYPNRYLINQLKDYFHGRNDRKRPKVLIGDKGSGKTFHLLKAMRKCVKESEDLIPVIWGYKKEGELKYLDPLKIAPREEWNERLSELDDADTVEAKLSVADVVIFDDFHYAAEAVKEGSLQPQYLIDFFKGILEEIKSGKKIVISSADQLSAYTDLVEDEEFEDIIAEFGFGDPKKKNVDPLSKLKVEKPAYDKWVDIYDNLGVRADENIMKFTHNAMKDVRTLIS